MTTVAPDGGRTTGGELRAVAGMALCLVAAAGFAARVILLTGRLTGAVGEQRLAAVAYGALRVAGTPRPEVSGVDTVTSALLTAYAGVTAAFTRYADVLGGARELSAALAVLLAACVLGLALRLGIRPVAGAIAFGIAALAGPLVAALVAFGPGLVAASCVALGVVLLTGVRRNMVVTVLGGLLVLTGVVSAPLTGVALLAGAAVLLGTGELGGRGLPARALGCLVLAMAAAALTVLVVRAPSMITAQGGTALDGTGRIVVLVVAGVVVLASTLLRWLRALGGVVAGAGVVGALPMPQAQTVLPLLVVATVLVIAGLADEAIGAVAATRPGRPGPRRAVRPAGVTAVLAVSALAAVAVATVLRVLPAQPAVPHAALAGWISGQTADQVPVAVPVGVWADLIRDGVPAGRLRIDDSPVTGPGRAPAGDGGGDLLAVRVHRTVHTAGRPAAAPGVVGLPATGGGPAEDPVPTLLARFGTAADGVDVVRPAPGQDQVRAEEREAAARRDWGRDLLANPGLRLAPLVRDELVAGHLDSRLLVVLTQLTGRPSFLPVEVTAAPAAAGEEGLGLPRRTLVIRSLGGRPVTDERAAAPLVGFVRAQLNPYAPVDVRVDTNGVTCTWTAPSPIGVLAS
jgi:hypothetical protein